MTEMLGIKKRAVYVADKGYEMLGHEGDVKILGKSFLHPKSPLHQANGRSSLDGLPKVNLKVDMIKIKDGGERYIKDHADKKLKPLSNYMTWGKEKPKGGSSGAALGGAVAGGAALLGLGALALKRKRDHDREEAERGRSKSASLNFGDRYAL